MTQRERAHDLIGKAEELLEYAATDLDVDAPGDLDAALLHAIRAFRQSIKRSFDFESRRQWQSSVKATDEAKRAAATKEFQQQADASLAAGDERAASNRRSMQSEAYQQACHDYRTKDWG